MTIRNKMVLAISTVVLLLLGYLSYVEQYSRDVVQQLKTLQEDELVLFETAWQIRWLDEVLTASAARYVQSRGEASWKQRYDQYATELDKAFEVASAKANETDRAGFADIAQSNRRLVALETRIFDATRAGRYDEANATLQGEYATQKQIYKLGVDAFFVSQRKRLQSAMAERVQQATANRQLAIAGLAGIALLITVLAVLVTRSIVVRLNRLSTVAERLAKGDINGLSVDVSGKDEVGRLANGMRGVLAAFEVVMEEAQGLARPAQNAARKPD